MRNTPSCKCCTFTKLSSFLVKRNGKCSYVAQPWHNRLLCQLVASHDLPEFARLQRYFIVQRFRRVEHKINDGLNLRKQQGQGPLKAEVELKHNCLCVGMDRGRVEEEKGEIEVSGRISARPSEAGLETPWV